MRIDVAWQRWDAWCERTRDARWRTSKHAITPPEDRQRAVDLEDALQAGERKLGVPLGTLRPLIEAERRAGRSAPEAVATVVERLRSG